VSAAIALSEPPAPSLAALLSPVPPLSLVPELSPPVPLSPLPPAAFVPLALEQAAPEVAKRKGSVVHDR